MRKTFLLLAVAGASLLTLFTSREAHAIGPLDIEIAAKVGYGTNPDGQLGFNQLGFGFGGRAGVSIFGLYAGVNLVDYLGGSETLCPSGAPPPPCPNISAHTLMYGGEFGYGFKISIVTIRPQIGVGSAVVYSGGSNASSLYLEPGVTGLVSFGLLFVGVDANVAIFPSSNRVAPDGTSSTTVAEAFTVHGQVGVRF
jgi:hypothetical protein